MIVNDTKKRARRGRSEGSIFQRESDGLWVGTASLGCNGAGKRVRRTVYGSTKKEVAGKLDTARMESRIGNLPDVGSMTIGQLLDQWLKTTEPKVSTRTFEERERLVKNHLRPRLGGLKIAKLNGLHIEGLYADMHRDQVG